MPLTTFTLWDPALLVVATVMGTLVAWLPGSRWRAFVVGLPLPFTLVNLSLDLRVGPSHVLGLAILLLFIHEVRWLHDVARWPALAAILVSDATYLGIAALLYPILPDTAIAFWTALGLVLVAGTLLVALQPERADLGGKSPIALPVKAAAITGVVLTIIVLKHAIGGFMAAFPMVTTVAAYEGRRDLWNLGRQIPVLMVTMGPMIGTMWIAQQLLGMTVALSLLPGWAVFLAILIPLTRWRMGRPRPQ